MSFSRLLLTSFIVFCLPIFAFGAALLPVDEVEALRDVAKIIGKTDWNFSADPCGGQWGWVDPNPAKRSENGVTCNCTFSNGTICHVVSIVLKFQNFEGNLPTNLGRFPYLQEIDLTRNYLKGTIPQEWGTTQLVNISIIANRLTGPIPKEIGNISTLAIFTVEFNQLSGVLPQELGNLARIEKLQLSSNNFTGLLPATFSKLTTLKDLGIQGSGLSGPIPTGIALLGEMTDLRISDLGNESESSFPQLSSMKNLKTLILRSCNIIGSIPDYVGELTDLITLLISGCSNSMVIDMLLLATEFYSFHINCGGKEATIGGNKYEDDTDPAGPSSFYQSRTNWAVSTTGHFMDDDSNSDTFTGTNATKLSANTSALYMDARLAPISLTYYGFCMGNGNYTVFLHFAEIMFTNDRTFNSLGRRFFDIYIQGKLVQKDFSIQNEAGGVGKAIIKNFTAVVTGNTLEMRFYWAGKGTTRLPVGGVYGPLISAISVTPDFIPPSEKSSSTSTYAGTVVGIVVAVVVVIVLILGILWWKGCFGQKISMHHGIV
ncbi:unnamed protein product [Dovyalis caffra]|uniref:non-specific serine/threonine protein kinase n=1 Tax=Dovyalis caffra TaxID=77055 RepID=A0AAV1SLL7_9ROSI|nr:unnamed protein product [Dovyalis caffra]